MSENLTGLVKIIGISVLLVILWIILATVVPDKFLTSNNIENLLRRTALFGILGIGVAFVIISSGIDLSIGSLVCLAGCLFAVLLQVSYVPFEESPVWQLNPQRGTLLVESADVAEGEPVWLFKDRRTQGLVTVTGLSSVTEGGRSFEQLQYDGEIRGGASEGLEIVAQLSKTYPVDVLNGGQECRLGGAPPRLRVQDRIRFVHPSEPVRERAVQAVGDDGTFQLDSPVGGIGEGYRAVPIRRAPLMSIPLAALVVLAVCLGLGLLHGLLITKLNQQPFIITLCGLLIYRGLARRLTNDQPVGFIEYGDTLGRLANGRWVLWGEGVDSFGIPNPFFVLILLVVLAGLFLNFTIWGRYLLALGRNEEAARYSGINTGRITIVAYVLCAVLTGIGGMMFAIDANSVPPSSFGNFFELYAIAAAVLGGCSLRGGEGSILGVVVGTALMQTLYNSIVLLGIPDTLEFTIIGAVILIGVVSDELVRRLANRWRR